MNRLNQQDLMVSLPKSAPDSISTVIVLELKGSAKTDLKRFVDANLSTQFLAYDAEQKGDPLKKSSGQKDSYYLYGWTNNNQEISWTFRTIEPGKFKLSADYIVDNQTGGSYLLAVDGVKTQHDVKQGKDGKGIRETIQIGEITLKPGLHTISMIPVEIKGKELMKILELNLSPLE
ncbi:hypothetical protein G7074_03045 [Pedobacter sp. HDW13]|uniref:hypothetical protein n=1 Tax=Pedobacter sp. HDW13 TaxID=2714940 RepID=UPI00140DF6B0|nr:hypothetical protein [Pedobacter sp. HDW13]QIL38345.1 hypothetical protein G7074_03045 [Pedobacter sp. HDW13]